MLFLHFITTLNFLILALAQKIWQFKFSTIIGTKGFAPSPAAIAAMICKFRCKGYSERI